MTTDMFHCRGYSPILLSPFMTDNRVCNKSNASGGTSGTGTAYPSGAPELTPGFSGFLLQYL